ncbi:MAG: hypothetical protein AAGI23_09580 [Bacteroidota bacterium]
MKLEKQFPYDQGWLHAKLSLTAGSTLTKDQAIKSLAADKDPSCLQIGHYEKLKTCIKVVYRDTSKPNVSISTSDNDYTFQRAYVHVPVKKLATLMALVGTECDGNADIELKEATNQYELHHQFNEGLMLCYHLPVTDDVKEEMRAFAKQLIKTNKIEL